MEGFVPWLRPASADGQPAIAQPFERFEGERQIRRFGFFCSIRLVAHEIRIADHHQPLLLAMHATSQAYGNRYRFVAASLRVSEEHRMRLESAIVPVLNAYGARQSHGLHLEYSPAINGCG